MIIASLAFYLFAIMTVGSALMVIVARNPVHSVLFLILAFFSSAGLFVLLGAEFLAMILVIVYVGAVAVLFMFVVMMLDINFVELRQGFLEYMPIGALIAVILLVEIGMVAAAWHFAPDASQAMAAPLASLGGAHNTEALGDLIYTKYLYLFQGAGVVLLIAMIGAIVLTHRRRPDVRRQDISEQVSRRRDQAVEMKRVEPGQGV